MSWLNNPRFVPVRESVIARLSDQGMHFRKVRPVVFLCGGLRSRRRDFLAKYLRTKHPRKPLVFYAEEVWDVVSSRSDLNALEMEEELAALSDLVIVVAESPGTFAELGAFALAPTLRSRLLLILNQDHKDEESFLRTGPVAWVDKESRYAPSIWANHAVVLDIVDELDDRLQKLPTRLGRRVERLEDSPKHLLFFLADLAAIFGPCPASHLKLYADKLLPRPPKTSVDLLLGLATAMRLVRRVKPQTGDDLFFGPPEFGNVRTFQEGQYVKMPLLRAKILSAMMRIPESRYALEALTE